MPEYLIFGNAYLERRAHRVPPQPIGIIPSNMGGFGDAEKAAAGFARNEAMPLLPAHLHEVNDWLGKDVIRFADYALARPNA